MPGRSRLIARARTVGPWRALCVTLAVCYLASAALRHDHHYSFALDAVLYTAVYAACALCCAARGRPSVAGDSAGIWRLFAVAIALYAFGWGAAAHWLTHDPVQPIPSIADVGWLSFYPVSFFACLRITRRLRIGGSSALAVLDATVAGLGAAAISAAFVVPSLAHDGSASWAVTLTDAAYPCGDLLLLGTIVTTLLAARFTAPAALWILFGGVIALICGDSSYLTGVAAGGLKFGGWVTCLGLVALVALALCAGARFTERAAPERTPWLVQAVPAATTLSSVTILLTRGSSQFRWIPAGLAALTIAGSVVRLMFSYYEARALADTRLLARTDELTGLVNRRGFQHEAAAALASANGNLAVLVVDLDGFKDINDGLGHPTGDELLRLLGERLAREARAGSLIARIGGDEFAVLADDTDGAADATAGRLLTAIRRPFELQGLDLRIDASIGIASAPQHGSTLDELLRHADMAMYRAKARHHGVVRYSMDVEQTGGALRTIGELRYALESDPAQIVLHYQPKVDLMSGCLCGVEALVRWQHPERGLLLPGEFLPLAEKAHLMQQLTERVLERAFADMPTWKGDLRGQVVAVNLPADAVSDPTLVQRVALLLESTGTPPQRLQLEITEDFLMADLAGARVVLDKLRVLGVTISIDDYGTGYSSLAYLRDLPVDELKLDRAFVQPILADKRASAIVRSTIDLAHSLGLRMVAEGIEDVDTWHRLLAMGCDIGQGYLFARPQSGADLELALAAPDSVLSMTGYGSALTTPDVRSSA